MTQYHFSLGNDITQFTIHKGGQQLIPKHIQPAIRGPLMVKVQPADTPQSIYDLMMGDRLPNHRWVPEDRDYQCATPKLVQVPVKQLDKEHRTRSDGSAGRPAELKLTVLKRIVQLLKRQSIKTVAATTGVSESTVAQISSGKAYWYVR